MVKELNDIFGIVLPQAGLVVAASGIILSLARDVFELQDRNAGIRNAGIHGGGINRPQLLYQNSAAEWLRNWLACFAEAILVFYLVVAGLLVLIQIEIVASINLEVFKVSVQIFHFIILILLLVILVKSIKVRELHVLGE